MTRLRTVCLAAALTAVALLVLGTGPASATAGWSAAVSLSPPGENSIDTRVAMNARGDAAVVWTHRIDPWHSSIEVSSRAGYGAFTAPAVVSNWQVMDARVVVDRNGGVTIVWAESGRPGDAGDVIRASAGRAGGTFGPPVTLWSDTGSSGTHNVCLGIDSAGTATAFWTAAAGEPVLRYATRTAGGAFGSVGWIANAGERVEWPACAVSANGDAFAAWTDGLRVQVAMRPAGSATFTSEVVRPFDQDRPLTSIAGLWANGRGDAIVTWSEATDQSNQEMWGKASRRPAGGAFGPPETIARSNGGLQPFIDEAGRTEAFGFAGSQLDTPVGEGIGSLTRGSDGHWGAYEQWSATGWEDSPAAAFDAAGNLFVASRYYYDRESPHGRALATIRSAGGHFPSEETPLSEDGHNVWQPALAAGAAGHAIAVWPRGETDDFHIELAEHGATPSVGGAASGDGPTAASEPGSSAGDHPGPGAGGSATAGAGAAPPRMTVGHRLIVKPGRHHRRMRCRRHVAHRHPHRACVRHRRQLIRR